MLQTLSIHHIVIIEKLCLSFEKGLSILTGETGAGKSILMDALGLVLGNRADGRLVRKGSEKGVVSACLLLPEHLIPLLEQEAIPLEEGQVFLKRELFPNGRSRAFINDIAVSQQLLRKIASELVEIHGQGENQKLLAPQSHRSLLDQYGGLEKDVLKTTSNYKNWQHKLETKKELEKAFESHAKEMAFLEFTLEEIDALNYQEGEEKDLEESRQSLRGKKQITARLAEINSYLTERPAPSDRLLNAEKSLSQIHMEENSSFEKTIKTLEGTLIQSSQSLSDAIRILQNLNYTIESSSEGLSLDVVEERLLDLKDFARKHHQQVSDLSKFTDQIKSQLSQGTKLEDAIKQIIIEVADAQKTYEEIAQHLHKKRNAAALKLDKALNQELNALKLNQAIFRTHSEALPLERASQYGLSTIAFKIQTNPGSPEGAIQDIASGGEASRIVLAMKIILSQKITPPVFIFDEVDTGIGGAVADAVGSRLQKLSKQLQLLVITHSPQIASKADHHFFISKENKQGETFTNVRALASIEARNNEIARMLSGEKLTHEALAAAKTLLSEKHGTRHKAV